jgi:hypothetical protein
VLTPCGAPWHCWTEGLVRKRRRAPPLRRASDERAPVAHAHATDARTLVPGTGSGRAGRKAEGGGATREVTQGNFSLALCFFAPPSISNHPAPPLSASSSVTCTHAARARACAMAATHVCGPVLPAFDASRVVLEGNKRAPGALGVTGRGDWYLCEELLLLHVDRKASFVASDARKMADALAAARAKLGDARLRGVLLLGRAQKLCSRVDTPARARPTLTAAGVAVYRVSA